MRICFAGTLFSLMAFFSTPNSAQNIPYAQAKCTVIYSLNRSADQYFNDEVSQLSEKIIRQNIQLVDLNHWRDAPPHIEISGRSRKLLRQTYELSNNINQALVFNNKGQIISRHTGSVSLVNTLLDCR